MAVLASGREVLIRALSDGDVHSGTVLAEQLGVSRTAVWKQLRQLKSLGLTIESLPGRGYRLDKPIELLDVAQITALLEDTTARSIESFDIHAIAESTNEVLRGAVPLIPGHMHVCMAEYQTGGRGRRGRQWVSPFGSGLCLSIAWTFDSAPPDLAALGLAVGLAVHRALSESGAAGLKLKWPNDLIAGQNKLAGILVDCIGEATGPFTAIVGIGINISVSQDMTGQVMKMQGLHPVGLMQIAGDAEVSRNKTTACLLNHLFAEMNRFARFGFAPIAEEWRRHDALAGSEVTVDRGDSQQRGRACGINADGSLRVDTGKGVESVFSGDISIRARQ